MRLKTFDSILGYNKSIKENKCKEKDDYEL